LGRGGWSRVNLLRVSFYPPYHVNELSGAGFTVVSVHPGWLATEMGNIAGEGGMPVSESAAHILKIVEGLRLEDGAKFFNYDGTTLPW
jgi:NAD(P)-dependent dehydrogenase (short-subunit alcohol dehydrogenase family)